MCESAIYLVAEKQTLDSHGVASLGYWCMLMLRTYLSTSDHKSTINISIFSEDATELSFI